jgi:plasmid maintenance system antidote protein VapI
MAIDTLTEKIRKHLLKVITDVMEKDDISQGELARRIGVQRYNVNKIVQEKKITTVDYLLKMAEGLGLDIELRIKKLKE